VNSAQQWCTVDSRSGWATCSLTHGARPAPVGGFSPWERLDEEEPRGVLTTATGDGGVAKLGPAMRGSNDGRTSFGGMALRTWMERFVLPKWSCGGRAKQRGPFIGLSEGAEAVSVAGNGAPRRRPFQEAGHWVHTVSGVIGEGRCCGGRKRNGGDAGGKPVGGARDGDGHTMAAAAWIEGEDDG
jgi:hypothetical protein